MAKQKEKVHFWGLLANVDSSILDVTLENGFEIKVVSADAGCDFISVLENLPLREIDKKLFMGASCVNIDEKKMYYVYNSKEVSSEPIASVSSFLNNLVHNYLIDKIRLLRLFKEGNVCMPLSYYFRIGKDELKPGISTANIDHTGPNPKYTLKKSEIPELNTFLKENSLPFQKEFLQLAFENFEVSYNIRDENLSFLVLMTGMETLFNKGTFEIRKTISRNTAVLLGKDKDDSWNIYKNMKDLYVKRSKIVHTGNKGIITNEDRLLLRQYLRDAIKKIYRLNKEKDKLIDLLDSSGFGNLK